MKTSNTHIVKKNVLHYYLGLMKNERQCSLSINNVINTMRLSRNSKICSEEFSNLNLTETQLYDIDFSNNGVSPSSFTNCKISIDSLMQQGHIAKPECIAISNDGHYFATGTNEKEGLVYIWDLYSHKLYRRIQIDLLEHPIPIECLAFSEDSKRIFIGVGLGSNVYEYDIETEQIIFGLEKCIKARDSYSRISIMQTISENEKQRDTLRKNSTDPDLFFYEAISWDGASMTFAHSFSFKNNDILSNFAGKRWDRGDNHYYYSKKISFIKSKANRIHITIEVQKRMFNKKTLKERIIETCNYTMIVDKKNMCVEYHTSPKIKVDIDLYYLAHSPKRCECDRFVAEQKEPYTYIITDKMLKTNQKITVGFDENVFIYLKDGYLVSQMFYEGSIIWDIKSLSVVNFVPLQLPHLPFLEHVSRKKMMEKMGVLSSNRKHAVFDKCVLYLRNVTNKLVNEKDFEKFQCMIDEYEAFFNNKPMYLLPVGWIKESQILYIHYNNFLFLIDVNQDSLIEMIPISRSIDLNTDCTYPNIFSNCERTNRIERIYKSSNNKYIAILYRHYHDTPEIEIIQFTSDRVINRMFSISNRISNACFLSDDILAIGTHNDDKSIILYDINKGAEIKRLFHLSNLHIHCCSFNSIIGDENVIEIIRQQGGVITDHHPKSTITIPEKTSQT